VPTEFLFSAAFYAEARTLFGPRVFAVFRSGNGKLSIEPTETLVAGKLIRFGVRGSLPD
jgi:hypothetical protein